MSLGSTLYDPVKLSIWSLAFYLAVWLFAPIAPSSEAELSIPALLYIAGSYIFFWAGAHLYRLRRAKPFVPEPPGKRMYWAICAIAFVGIALRIYDQYFVRGLELLAAGTENRETLADNRAGPLSMLGGALYPFCYIPAFIAFNGVRNRKWRRAYLLWSWPLFFYPAIEATLLLSRSQTVALVILTYVTWRHFSWRGHLIDRRSLTAVAAIAVAVITASGLIFQERLEQGGADIGLSLDVSSYARTVKPSATGTWLMEVSSGTPVEVLFTSTINIAQYVTHGLLEFCSAVDAGMEAGFSAGAQTFNPYFKAAYVVGLAERNQDLFLRNPIMVDYAGLFLTFFGPLWQDFGALGIFLMAPFGYWTSSLGARTRRGDIYATPLYLFLVMVVLSMPVGNMIVGAMGNYTINAMLAFFILGRLQRATK